MNEENPWDGMVNVEVIEGTVEPFAINKVKIALGIMKNGKACEPTEIVKKHLAASPHGNQVISQIANEIFYGENMPHDCRTSTVAPIYKEKGSVMCELSRCEAFRAWYESGGKVVREEVKYFS